MGNMISWISTSFNTSILLASIAIATIVTDFCKIGFFIGFQFGRLLEFPFWIFGMNLGISDAILKHGYFSHILGALAAMVIISTIMIVTLLVIVPFLFPTRKSGRRASEMHSPDGKLHFADRIRKRLDSVLAFHDTPAANRDGSTHALEDIYGSSEHKDENVYHHNQMKSPPRTPASSHDTGSHYDATTSISNSSSYDDAQTVDYSQDGDYQASEGEEAATERQILQKSVTDPRVLVGWRVNVHSAGSSSSSSSSSTTTGTGRVLKTVKSFGGSTKFLVEMEGHVDPQTKKLLQIPLALQRSEKKGDVPFTLIEKMD
mmetsp:Transcript_4092/g.6503  ORF Transcript_4092/g.6503 Transcript_4092/m.6503 type:complete len:317 (-) Transcript_4092:90-1040(-)